MQGLVGAHRTGKTTLASEVARLHGWEFAQTSVSAIFKSLGYNPAQEFDFGTRLTIQEEILRRMDAFYAKVSGPNVITDRTPIDMLAYTMAEAIGERVTPDLQGRFAAYADACFDVTNRRFTEILLVQPGIQLVREEGKAALNMPYIEHLNSLMLGLCSDERMKVPHYYIPKHRIDLGKRVESVLSARRRSVNQAFNEMEQLSPEEIH